MRCALRRETAGAFMQCTFAKAFYCMSRDIEALVSGQLLRHCWLSGARMLVDCEERRSEPRRRPPCNSYIPETSSLHCRVAEPEHEMEDEVRDGELLGSMVRVPFHHFACCRTRDTPAAT